MKNKNSGIKWHKVFGAASVIALIVFAVMLYIDFGTGIKSSKASGKEKTEGSALDSAGQDTTATEAETKVSNKAVVCIDASHGGSDTGQYDGTNYEKTQVLEMAKLVEAELTKRGVKVVMTRTDDESVDYTSRIKKSNQAKAVVLVSLHRDIAKKSGAGMGVSTWIHTSSPSDSNKLANGIIGAFKESGVSVNGVNTGTPDNSAKDYYLNQHSSSASCIVELGNMYSSEDNKLVSTDKEKTAKAIADGIIKYLEQAGYING